MNGIYIGERKIYNGCRPYFVAEVNSSHNGNLGTAIEMTDEIKRIGCDAVKFQSWSTETLYSKDYYNKNPIAKRMVTKFSMSEEDLYKISEHCNDIGLTFFSTPYSVREVDYLVDVCKAPVIKIASMDINNLEFIKYIAKKNVPVILSTGMSVYDEIERAVRTVEDTGNYQLCILHCVSQYPVEIENVNVKNICMLMEKFPEYTIGYSDHTIGSEAAMAAVAIGASLIEKHFTLDSRKLGWDNQMATEPSEFSNMINGCIKIHSSLGNKERNISSAEFEQRMKMRRSVVAACDILSGTKLDISCLDVKRPGTGIPADEIYSLLGKKVNRDILKDEIIYESYLEENK